MPELPELEVVREVLQRRVIGAMIADVALVQPGAAIVLRDLTGIGFVQALRGARLESVRRHGKFLAFDLSATAGPCYLTINPKLTGRLQLAAPEDKRVAKTHALLSLSTGMQLRYIDQKQMGQVYISHEPPAQAGVPDFANTSPDALEITLDDFRLRLRKHHGEIKGILTNSTFVIGIGNAYADEILWAARIHPYRKRPTLTQTEIATLHASMCDTLIGATANVRAVMGEKIHLKPRDFLNVHMKTGEPCPRCGSAISLVGANQRITNFCRQCQPGGLIRGM